MWAGIDSAQAKRVQTRFRSLNDMARFRLARRRAWEAVYPRSTSESLLIGEIAEVFARIDRIIKERPQLGPSREAVQAASTGFVVGKRLSAKRRRELLRPFGHVI